MPTPIDVLVDALIIVKLTFAFAATIGVVAIKDITRASFTMLHTLTTFAAVSGPGIAFTLGLSRRRFCLPQCFPLVSRCPYLCPCHCIYLFHYPCPFPPPFPLPLPLPVHLPLPLPFPFPLHLPLPLPLLLHLPRSKHPSPTLIASVPFPFLHSVWCAHAQQRCQGA